MERISVIAPVYNEREHVPRFISRVEQTLKAMDKQQLFAAGFKICSGDLVVTMDSDLQTDPEDIYHLMGYIDDYNMINGKRETREGWTQKKNFFTC